MILERNVIHFLRTVMARSSINHVGPTNDLGVIHNYVNMPRVLLLELGADVNLQTRSSGWTPLMYTVQLIGRLHVSSL
jgi:hypothetical protein